MPFSCSVVVTEVAEPCSTCAGGRGTFRSCVASPDIIDSAGNVAPYMPARVPIAFGTVKARSVRSILASPVFGNPISIFLSSNRVGYWTALGKPTRI
jgi:hypothetical protein